MNLKHFGMLMLLVVAVAFVSCTQMQPLDYTPPQNTEEPSSPSDTTNAGETQLEGLQKFESTQALEEFLAKQQLNTQSRNSYYGGVATRGMDMMESAVASAAPMAADEDGSKSAGASDFSSTNIQVENVDEGDFVKNDDRYIYMIADNKLVIIDAYDAQNAKILSETRFADDGNDYYNGPQARELFVNGNTVVVFVQSYEPSFYFPRYEIMPQRSYKQVLYVEIYDVTDREEPELKESFKITGNYFKSRMIDNMVYVIAQDPVNSWGGGIVRPMVASDAKMIHPDVYYFDHPEQNYQFNTVASINLDTAELVDSKTLMLGYSNTLMMTEESLYIAFKKQQAWWGRVWGMEYDRERFTQVVLPRLSGELKTDIEAIIAKDLEEQEEWEQISLVLEKFYEGVDEDELDEIYETQFEEVVEALEEYDTKKALEDAKTVIHKLSVDNGKITPLAQGEVIGDLLNQFSLDEHDGKLRVATTLTIWNRKRIQENNVFVLDEDMRQIGELTGIAPDEQIYSTRFMGDRLYMVTFKQIDPFFVIDLKDPRNPTVLGELKVPGYSSYLHPYDENLIIGVGKDADEHGRVGGLKLALFDASDVENPEEVDMVTIGDAGSDSPVLYDHRAFLFSKSKELLVLPVTIVEDYSTTRYRSSYSIWHGAYAYKVTENGFELLGKVRHDSTKNDYWYWWAPASVMRSLYMDDNLYTISNKYVKINDLSNELEEINSVRLPYNEQYPQMWY